MAERARTHQRSGEATIASSVIRADDGLAHRKRAPWRASSFCTAPMLSASNGSSRCIEIGGGDAGALAAHSAAHHVTRRSVRHVVAADAASGDQQVADALGHQRPIGHVPVAAGRRQNQDAVAIDELGKDADRIIETAPARARRCR